MATSDLASSLGLDITNRQSPGATIVTNPLDGDLFRSIVAMHSPKDAGGELLNARHLSDGRVMIHGQRHDEQNDRPEDAERLFEEAKQYLPVLNELNVAEVRRAVRPMPPDNLPAIGWLPESHNAYVTYTHSGVTLAPLIGEMAALEIAEDVCVESLAPFRPDRFDR